MAGPPVTGPPAPPPGRARRTRTTLAVRVTLLVIAVAVLVATVAAVVGVLLVRRSLLDISTEALSDRADLVATQIAADPAAAADILAATARALDGQQTGVVLIGPDGSLAGGDQVARRAARQAGASDAVGGRSVSGRASAGGELQLVEARSTTTGGFALVTPADVAAETRRTVEGRLIWAVAAGLVAALLIGLLIARVVSAPLRRTADLARQMGHGARDVRVPVAGPREVADVSIAVNELADALQHSESRQRDFLASVSHELRTPLAGISGQAQALADGLVGAAEQAEVGGLIQGEAVRMERLISDLLDLARLGADRFTLDVQPVDLTALLDEMAQVWRPRCDSAGVPLVLDVPPSPVPARTDPRRLRQVLDGLADNALRVLPAGGPLVLSLRAETAGPPWAAVLQVRDGGPGLAPEDYPVAFLPGELHRRYRGRRPTGAGLGLALAHGLVQRLGGTIAASPAPEGGVAMTIRLPSDVPTP
ncbi:histidine kinase dimerization/phospho-acceptor domain-containing protein [Nakamurella sp.]|uniref:HAMP domain-containing sensor histidine kinase n=1 Tax=Nakamurella sp. TaxID=1869182 RepID=UPI0037847AB7